MQFIGLQCERGPLEVSYHLNENRYLSSHILFFFLSLLLWCKVKLLRFQLLLYLLCLLWLLFSLLSIKFYCYRWEKYILMSNNYKLKSLQRIQWTSLSLPILRSWKKPLLSCVKIAWHLQCEKTLLVKKDAREDSTSTTFHHINIYSILGSMHFLIMNVHALYRLDSCLNNFKNHDHRVDELSIQPDQTSPLLRWDTS